MNAAGLAGLFAGMEKAAEDFAFGHKDLVSRSSEQVHEIGKRVASRAGTSVTQVLKKPKKGMSVSHAVRAMHIAKNHPDPARRAKMTKMLGDWHRAGGKVGS